MNPPMDDHTTNLQYLTQLVQNGDYYLHKYQSRKNLLNSDNLPFKDLLTLFREFQTNIDLHSKEPYNSSPTSNEFLQQFGMGQQKPTIEIEISTTYKIQFPSEMLNYQLRYSKISLLPYANDVSLSVIRRVIFLCISGFIGFDDFERVEIIKSAFLLEFDEFFEYLWTSNPNIRTLLAFENQEDCLEIINFMWSVNVGRSMRYYEFLRQAISMNPKFYLGKDGCSFSSKILNLDIILMETQFLPTIQRELQKDSSLSLKDVHSQLKQLIEYYEIMNNRTIFYPDLVELSEERAAQEIESKFESLIREFECPVCYMPFENCHISKCGHSFCKKCIQDAVTKYGRCPICKAQINLQTDVFKNFHLDKIREISDQDKDHFKQREVLMIRQMNQFKSQFQQNMQINIMNYLTGNGQIIQLQSNENNQENNLPSNIEDSLSILKENRSIANVIGTMGILKNTNSNPQIEQLKQLKKQISHLVNTTYDQVISSLDIQS